MNLIVLHYMPRTTRGWIEGRCKFIRSTEDDDQCTLRRSIGTDVRVKSNYTYVITMQMHLQTPFKSSKHAAAERNRLLTHENIGKSINSHLCSMHGGNNSALINCLQKKKQVNEQNPQWTISWNYRNYTAQQRLTKNRSKSGQ